MEKTTPCLSFYITIHYDASLLIWFATHFVKIRNNNKELLVGNPKADKDYLCSLRKLSESTTDCLTQNKKLSDLSSFCRSVALLYDGEPKV